MSELIDILARHCNGTALPSPIPRLMLSQSDVVTAPMEVLYYPLFCLVAQGRKRVWLGEQEFIYDPSSYLITSAHVPVTGQVIGAPFFGFTLALEPALVADLLMELPPVPTGKMAARAIAVGRVDAELLDPVLRLLRLLDRPRHIPVLAPMIERELLYLLLQGPFAETLRQFAAPASPLAQIRRAIEWIREHYNKALRVEAVARIAGMSPPSFHRHFRAVTNLSPLQFQKRIRLQEARRRLLTEHTDAASVAFDVGYESPSQFSREYRRMFGAPPARDVGRVRQRQPEVALPA